MMISTKQVIGDNYRPSTQALANEKVHSLTESQTVTRLKPNMVDIEEFRKVIKLHKNLK